MFFVTVIVLLLLAFIRCDIITAYFFIVFFSYYLICYLFCFFFFLMIRRPPISTLFPYPPLFRSGGTGCWRAFEHQVLTVRWPNIAVPTRTSVAPSWIATSKSWLMPIDSSRSRDSSIPPRSEEHTSELQSQSNLVCRLLLEKKNKR